MEDLDGDKNQRQRGGTSSRWMASLPLVTSSFAGILHRQRLAQHLGLRLTRGFSSFYL